MIFFSIACQYSALDPIVEDSSSNPQEEEVDPITQIDPTQLPASEIACREPILVSVNHVVDGDTVYVQTTTGEEKIRLIGVDTPEFGYDGDPDECYATEAKRFLEQLIEDKQIWLTFDQTCVDTYNRTLAYLHTDIGSHGFVQRQILQRGMAPDFPFSDTPAFNSVFAEDAANASAAGIGGWSACGWNE